MRAAARAVTSPANDSSPRAIESWSDRKKRKRKRRKEQGVVVAVVRSDPVDPRIGIVVVASHRKVQVRVEGIRGEAGRRGDGAGRNPQSWSWRLVGAVRSRRLWQVGSYRRISAVEP